MAQQSVLRSVVYVSAATRLMSDTELRDLLQQSQQNNARLGVTGMLLYAEGSFMQVLEGPREVVDATMSRISDDLRHTNVQVLLQQDIAAREFENWSMAFRTFDRTDHRDLEAFSPFLTGNALDAEFRAQPVRSYRLLRSFKEALR